MKLSEEIKDPVTVVALEATLRALRTAGAPSMAVVTIGRTRRGTTVITCDFERDGDASENNVVPAVERFETVEKG